MANKSTRPYDPEHIHFGGIIYPSDFNNEIIGLRNNNGSTIAARIVSDWKFDKNCKQNATLREYKNTYQKEHANV